MEKSILVVLAVVFAALAIAFNSGRFAGIAVLCLAAQEVV